MLPINQAETELWVYQTDGAYAKKDDPEWHLDPPAPDVVIPGADIASLTFSERLADRKDDGQCTLYNDGGQYTDAVTSGDRIEVRVTFEVPVLETWGDGAWGDDVAWPGQRIVWTAWVRDRTFIRDGATDRHLELACEDFVFGILGERYVDFAHSEFQVVAALQQLLAEQAPEVRHYIDPTVDHEAELNYSGEVLLDVANDLLGRGDLVAHASRDLLVAEPLTAADVTPRFTVTGADLGLFDVNETDDGLTNWARVDGGEDISLGREWTCGPDEWMTINQPTAGVRFRLAPVAMPELGAVELYTHRISDTDDLTVTIQLEERDDDAESGSDTRRLQDVARRTLDAEFIAEDGWTRFLFPDHSLHDMRPWILVRSAGETGHMLGLGHRRGDPELWFPMYRLFYPYPIATREVDDTSVADYRRRENRRVDDTISTYEEAEEIAREMVRHNNTPEQQLQTTADSRRMHMLRPGEVVTFDFPEEDTTGDYLLIERTDTYDGLRLETDLTFQEVESV